MNDFDNQPRHPEAQQVAWGIAVAVSCGYLAWEVIATRMVSWPAAVAAIALGGVAWGVVFALGVVVALIRPSEPPVAPAYAVEPEEAEEAYIEADNTPEWREHLGRYLSGDLLRIGNTSHRLPAGFDRELLYTIAEARWWGRLPTVSARALDAAGISRFANGGEAPAVAVMDFLERIGLIRSGGVQRPYSWTDAGERVFPSPTATARNGNGSGGTRLTTAATTAATAAPPPIYRH
jgi:hypothetical protein